MTDLEQALLDASAGSLGHLVSIHDHLDEGVTKARAHLQHLSPRLKEHDIATNAVDVGAAHVARIRDVILEINPNALALELPVDDVHDPAPVEALQAVEEEEPEADASVYPGTMVISDDLETRRSQRIRQVVEHATGLADARFTDAEKSRHQVLWSQTLAAQNDAAPALTQDEADEMALLDADRLWATSAQEEAWARVRALLVASADELADYQPGEGWPE